MKETFNPLIRLCKECGLPVKPFEIIYDPCFEFKSRETTKAIAPTFKM